MVSKYLTRLLAAVLFLLLSACSGLTELISAPTPTWSQYRPLPAGAEAASQYLATQMGVSPDRVRVISVKSQGWADTCMGLSKVTEVCEPRAISGYQVTAVFERVQYVYHTDLAGTLILQDTSVTNPTEPTVAMQGQLAELLGVPVEEIVIVAEASRHFQDTCLDIGIPDNACGKYPEWGVQTVLEAAGHQFEFRSLFSTISPVLAQIDHTDSYTPVIRLVQSDNSATDCIDIAVYLSGIVTEYFCSNMSAEAPGFTNLTSTQFSEMLQFVLQYSDFNLQKSETAGKHTSLNFVGLGTEAVSDETKESVKVFAQGLKMQTPAPPPTQSPTS